MHGTLPKKHTTKEERLAELREMVPFMPIHKTPRSLLTVEELAALLYIAECFERNEDPVKGYKFDMSFIIRNQHYEYHYEYMDEGCGSSACICGDMFLLSDPEITEGGASFKFHVLAGIFRTGEECLESSEKCPEYGMQRLFMPWQFGGMPSSLPYNNRPAAAHAIRTYLETDEPEWIL